jgi:hypothetical protein
MPQENGAAAIGLVRVALGVGLIWLGISDEADLERRLTDLA